MDDMNKKINNQSVQNVMNTARQVFGAEDCKKIERFLQDEDAVKNITSKLSGKDLESAAAIMNDPVLLKKILSSPKAAESLKRILGGK